MPIEEPVAVNRALPNIVERGSGPNLSAEAKALLIAASNDKNAYIITRDTVQGFIVTSNNQQFVQAGNARSRATWVNAIQELLGNYLISQERADGLYRVTMEGFELADVLKARQA